MSDEMAQWVRDALAHAKMTQPMLAEHLTKRLKRSFDKAAINKMAIVKLKPGAKRRLVKADEMMAIAEITGFPAPISEEAPNVVGVYGIVAAGGQIDAAGEQLAVGGEPLYEIEVPFSVPNDAFALQVRGESMWPRYDDGDVIICYKQSQDPVPLIGWEAAVGTPEGTRYLKKLVRGSRDGLYNLESHNAGPIRDVTVSWVSEVFGLVRAARWRRLNDKARRREIRKAVA